MNTKFITDTVSHLNLTGCPYCQSPSFVKNGTENGNQRYQCKKCKKGFRSTTSSPIHRLHLKTDIPAYIECLHEGLTLRQAAQKVGISLGTSFRWRHRLLAGLKKKTEQISFHKQSLSALSLPFSNKGCKTKEKNSETVTSIIFLESTGRMKIEILGKYRTQPKTLFLATKKSAHYLPDKRLPRFFKSGKSSRLSIYELSQIREVHAKIKLWLEKFRGVATKYLDNYWAWFSIKIQFEIMANPEHRLLTLCV